MAAYEDKHKQVSTWVAMGDFRVLQSLAAQAGVTISIYLRAIIVDAVQDELEKMNKQSCYTTTTKDTNSVLESKVV